MQTIKILDKEFRLSIPASQINEAVSKVAAQINNDLREKDVLFLGILNGSFMFAADLFRKIEFPCQISFIKVSSYQGTSSTGKTKQLIGINENVKGRTIVILEDIVDTGLTIEKILEELKVYEPEDIKIATFLLKRDVFKKNIPLNYVGIEIPNDFIVGYGLDYNGYGRNFGEIYSVI